MYSSKTTNELLDYLLFAYDMIRDSATPEEQLKRWEAQFTEIRNEIMRRVGEFSERPL